MEKNAEKTINGTKKNNVGKEAECKMKVPEKKTNKTWEAFGKSKGCFIINDPKFLL